MRGAPPLSGLRQLVVAGGVGANLRPACRSSTRGGEAQSRVFYPELELCTDNGAMIALAGALRLQAGLAGKAAGAFAVRPRWPLTGAR
jgi:N6-L-threonylcarbamoyladenine synthase